MPFKNFSYSTVSVAPTPAASGTAVTVATGDGARFPATFPFRATVWPSGVRPLASNAEIVEVTAITGDVLTIVRAKEGSTARSIVVGDQIAATITAAVLWSRVSKTADQSFTSGVLAADADLQFSLASGKTYAFRAYCLLFSDGAGAGNTLQARANVTGTAPANASWTDAIYLTTFSGHSGGIGLPSTTRSAAQSAGVTEDGLFEIRGIVKGGAGSATFQLEFAGEAASGADFKVRAGSYVEFAEMGT